MPVYSFPSKYGTKNLIDDALDELDSDHDDGVVDKDHVSDDDGACSFEVGEAADGEVDGVIGIASEAEGEVVEGESFYPGYVQIYDFSL